MTRMMLEVESEYQCVAEGFSQCSTSCGRDGTESDAKLDYAEVEREIAQETAAVEQAAHATMLSALDPMRRRCWWAARPSTRVLPASASTRWRGR